MITFVFCYRFVRVKFPQTSGAFYVFGLFSNFDFEHNDKIAQFTALCNFLVEIDFSNSDGSDFLRDLLGQRSMMRERDLSGPAEQNGLNGPGLYPSTYYL